MADKKIVLDVVLNTANSAASLKDIKKSLKELQDAAIQFGEGTEEFEKISAAAGELKDKLEDVNQAINAKKGTGFEKLGGELDVLKNKINGLDFTGINESVGRFAGQLKSFSFKDIIEGAKGFGQVLGTLGKAILSNPLFLLAAVVIGIGAALFALKDKIKIVGDAIAFLGDIIDGVIQFFKDLSDAIGLTTFAAEESAQAQIDAAKKSQTAVEERYNAEKRLAKAAGKDVSEIELQKQEALRETLNQQIEGLETIQELNGKLTEDQQKEYDELQKALRESNLVTQETIIAQETKAAEDRKKLEEKEADDRKKRAEKAAADAKKAAEERAAANKDLIKQIEDQEISLIKNDEERAFAKAVLDNERAIKAIEESKASNEIKNKALIEQELVFQAQLKAINDKAAADKKAADEKALEEKKAADKAALDLKNADKLAKSELKVVENENDTKAKIALLETQRDIELQNEMLTGEQKKVIRAKYAKEIADLELSEEERKKNATFDIAKASNDSLMALSDLYFAVKLANTKKGSKEEEKAARQQFKINKSLSIVSATISGIQGVVNALSAQSTIPEPYGTILKVANAVAVGVAAAANIAKISAQQFNPGSSGGGGGGSAAASPNAPAGIAAAATPNVPQQKPNDFSLFGTAGKANNLSQSKPTEIRAVVLESDITNTQKKVNNFKTASEL